MTSSDPTPERGAQPGSRRRLWLLLGAVLLHGLVYSLLLPPWMGEDEPWHFENLTHVANGHGAKSDRDFKWDDQEWAPLTQGEALRRFAGLELEEAARVQREILGSMNRSSFWRRVDWTGRGDATESFDQVAMGFSTAQQPPLYYFLAAPIVVLASHAAHANLETQLFLVRLLSLALFVATVFLTYSAGRIVFSGEDDRPALLAAFFVGWFPMHARMAAVVNNDVLARFLVTLALLLSLKLVASAKATRTRMQLVWLLVVCALCVATKTTAFSAIPIAGLGFVLISRETGPRGNGLLNRKWLLIPLAILVTLGAVFFWRSMNNPAVPYSLEQLAKRFDYALSPRSFLEIRDSFLGAFNWESRAQADWIQTGFGLFLLAAIAGSLIAIRRAGSERMRRMLLLCFGAFSLQFALILLRGVGKGRYLMPVIAALAILVVAGLVQGLPERVRARAGVVLVLALVCYDAVFLWSGLVANQYLVWGS